MGRGEDGVEERERSGIIKRHGIIPRPYTARRAAEFMRRSTAAWKLVSSATPMRLLAYKSAVIAGVRSRINSSFARYQFK